MNPNIFTEQQIYVLFEILSDFKQQIDVANYYDSETEQTEQTGLFEAMEKITVLQSTMAYTINQITMAESHRIINDVQFMIFMGSPVHLTEGMTTGTRLSGNTYHWWTHRHPHLHDGRGIDSFRAHYRINIRTFNFIVMVLKQEPEFAASDERDNNVSHPVWMQVAIVLWRFSNTHLGYRMAGERLGVSQSSYT
ncbi:hypothetical protein INT47_007390 [Mucor saturninus]|uniref:Uncharacterized protein n=1 Tax=Mucor saturninus TaxID=64648 RepID=A0A8H7QJP5_9FUNG|nr:hypothetical protein INT47_007390 [Mucor saturninus]